MSTGGTTDVARPGVDGIHHCPVCRSAVTRTRSGMICGHYDGIGETCRASFYPYDITISERPHELVDASVRRSDGEAIYL